MDRVLVIFPGALGDLICFAPALNAIARRHRGAELELMAREELAQFAVGRLGMARGHSIDRREVSLLFGGSENNPEAGRFFGTFAHVYSFFAFDDEIYRRALTATARRVTFHRFRPDSGGHIALAYLREIGNEAGRGPEDLTIRLDLLPQDLRAASEALSNLAEPKRFIAIFPGSGSPVKNWPLDRFIELARQIERSGARAVFILGPTESFMASTLIGDNFATLKELPLGAVAALARLASAFIGCDSGVCHLAASAGGRGVVLFGPTNPLRWCPIGDVIVIHRNLETISAASVLQAVDRMTLL